MRAPIIDLRFMTSLLHGERFVNVAIYHNSGGVVSLPRNGCKRGPRVVFGVIHLVPVDGANVPAADAMDAALIRNERNGSARTDLQRTHCMPPVVGDGVGVAVG